jgi:hypothetical protein
MERVIVQFRGSVLGLSFGDHSLSRAAQLMVAFRRKGRLRFDELLLDPPLFQRVAFDLVFVGSGSIWLTDERFEGFRKPSSDHKCHQRRLAGVDLLRSGCMYTRTRADARD